MNSQPVFQPQLTITIEDERANLRGYVVIDSTIGERAVGGLRMLPDVSLEEVKALARTMTLKYAFAGLRSGGAKGAIVGDPEMPAADKQQLLVSFFKALQPILKSGLYLPRPDMGTHNGELIKAAEAAGIRKRQGRSGSGERSGLYTGFSVVGASLAVLDRLKIPVPGCSVAIEGFGKVGSSVAQLFARYGAKVVAVSTRYGAIYSSYGLDVSKLIQLYERHGSGVVEHYQGAERIEISELLELEVDVLSPCARFHSIDALNAPKIAAKAICAGANNPVTYEADDLLFERGVLCPPDFVSNAGGMLGEAMEFAGLSEDFVREFLVSKFRSRVGEILDQAQRAQRPPRKHLEPLMLEKFMAMKAKAENPDLRSRILRVGKTLYSRGLIPQLVVQFLSRYYFAKAFRAQVSNART